ncbi:MAG: PIG-L family deacetylase [Candidatus Caenarcaniphilales bacterium]|nr:PIG-L family deacetylase [Candidatus Caenarcaniphilales bacterium]
MKKLAFLFGVVLFMFNGSLESGAKKLNVMVFAPHPDDEVIGCGGSIAKHVKQGNEVTVVYMTSGDSGNIEYSKKELAKLRENEAKAGAKFLGVNKVVFLRNPDGYLEVNQDNLVKVLSVIREYKPDVVYVPSREEGHRDHKSTNAIVLDAVGRASGPWFQETSYAPWSVSTVLEYEVNPPMQNIHYCEDISDFIELKVKALQMHKSQIDDIHYDKAVEALNLYRGAMTHGTNKYSECFKIVKIKKVF